MAETVYQYAKTKTKITIGDKDTFKPKAKMAKFDDAHSFTLEITGLGTFTTTTTASKVKGTSVDKDFSIEYSQTPVNVDFNDEGGLDIVITQGKSGLSNVLNFTYSNDHVVGYLQPPLTPEEIAEGCVRPDHVVNSIAFYCTDKGGIQEVGGIEWKTGKIGHLYRMKASSYDGKVAPVWCDWSISGNVVSLTIPLAWWNDTKTKFPITIAPVGDTFGYTTGGGSASASTRIRTGKFTSGANAGTSTQISIYGDGDTGWTLAAGIYSNNAGAVNAKLAVDSGNVSFPLVTTWYNVPISYAVLANTVYWLCGWAGGGSGVIYYDAGDSSQGALSTTTSFETWPDPFNAYSYADRKYSIHCDYTPAAGGWSNIKNVRAGTGSITATDLSHIWFGTTAVAVADIAEIPTGVAV
jgi:hypothetical protein